jgi:HAD superfamily hydrolase (TIGR01549 family)
MSEYLPDTTKAVMFDHDDTLVGTIEPKWRQFKYIAKLHYNKEISDEELRTHWGKPLRSLVGILNETDDIDLAFERIMAVHKDFPKVLFEETLPTLNELKRRGLKLGLVTATSLFSLEHDLDVLGIPKELFDFMQSEEDTDFHKPDARVFDPAKQWLGVNGMQPREVIYVGDGLHDGKAAIESGMNFIGVETGLVTKKMFIDAGFISVSGLAKLISDGTV